MSLPALRHSISTGGRLLVAGCLLVALLSPPERDASLAPTVAVVVDDSLSMPSGFVDQVWQETGALRAELPAAGSLRLLRFAATVAEEDPAADEPGATLPRSAPLDRGTTDIGSALREALYRLPADRPAAGILVSDGAATHGDTGPALEQWQRAGVPVYLLAPPPLEGTGAPRLVDLLVPDRARMGEPVALRAQLQGAAGTRAALSLRVDGIPQARRQVVLPVGAPAFVAFDYRPSRPGLVELSVHLEEAPGGLPGGSRLNRIVNVQGRSPVVYLGSSPQGNPVVDGLRAVGVEPVTLVPAALSAHHALLERAGLIVLDDVAVAAVGEHDWAGLAAAVQTGGSGLLVLGGEHSFGAGGYRHSPLESLLPVTAEAAQPQPQAAVLFLLDASGSMDRQRAGPSRFDLGRQAVAGAARQLQPGDLVGVTVFAGQVDVRLPLAQAVTVVGEIAPALELAPGGGTRLEPALLAAAEQLRDAPVAQRLLILVTDGFASDENLLPIAARLEREGITVIALAVGEEPDLATLERLTRFNQGRVLPVADVMTLPRLMSVEVAAERAPSTAGATPVAALQPLPFMSPGALAWPPLEGYAVTRLREGADLYLQSGRGDPVLATGFAGAGRVAVLPGGLGDWARAWREWPRLDDFLGGLMHWLGGAEDGGDLWLELEEHPGQLEFTVEQEVTDAQHPVAPRLVLRDPAGALIELPLALQAPGRFHAVHEVALTGRYLATLQGPGQVVRYGFYRNPGRDIVDAVRVSAQRRDWLQRELLRPWPGNRAFLAALEGDGAVSRSLPVALAGLGYLALLLWERGLLQRPPPAFLFRRGRRVRRGRSAS